MRESIDSALRRWHKNRRRIGQNMLLLTAWFGMLVALPYVYMSIKNIWLRLTLMGIVVIAMAFLIARLYAQLYETARARRVDRRDWGVITGMWAMSLLVVLIVALLFNLLSRRPGSFLFALLSMLIAAALFPVLAVMLCAPLYLAEDERTLAEGAKTALRELPWRYLPLFAVSAFLTCLSALLRWLTQWEPIQALISAVLSAVQWCIALEMCVEEIEEESIEAAFEG